MVAQELNILFYVEKDADLFFAEKKIYTDQEPLPEADILIVSQICEFEEINSKERVYFSGKIISLKQIIDDLWKAEWCRNDISD